MDKLYSGRDIELMRMAIAVAHECTDVATAYNVGAVIASSDKKRVLSTGFSRQLPGNTHAEECALQAITSGEDLVLYTTMEPCSKRLSGNTPCVQRILDSGSISRVYVGVREPPNFVVCTGAEELTRNGIKVVYVDEVAPECQALNRHLAK